MSVQCNWTEFILKQTQSEYPGETNRALNLVTCDWSQFDKTEMTEVFISARVKSHAHCAYRPMLRKQLSRASVFFPGRGE